MTTLSKYTYVNDVVNRLTDNKSLKTFYTLFLMADTDEERLKLNDSFKEASLSLEGEALINFKRDFTESFKKIMPLVKDLNIRVAEFSAAMSLNNQTA